MNSVLIVEDEAIVAADLADKLRHLGYQILDTAARGEDAVAVARARRPDLVLIDIRLAGGMNGIEAAEQIRRECGLPVIYLTAHSDPKTLQRAKVTEPFGYILKPFLERELQTHLQMALYKHRAEQELRAREERLHQLNARLEERVLERTAQLRALTAELTRVEERERRRIAQLLHNHLQQLLVGARIQMETSLAATDEKARQKFLRKACQLVDESTQVSRELSHELSPPILHDAGLAEALKWLGSWMQQKHGLAVRVEPKGSGPPLPEDLKLLLFHAARELLFNVIKHAQVKRASLRLVQTDRQVEVVVSDPGRGFDAARLAPPRAKGSSGLGLFTIRERLQWIGGEVQIRSSPRRGCQVRIVAPVRTSALVEVATQAPVPGPALPERRAGPEFARRTRASRAAAGAGAEIDRAGCTRLPSLGTAASKIRVLLAENHEVMRATFTRLLEQECDLEVVGAACNGAEAVALTGELEPDVILMDVNMPVLDGIEATRRIAAAHPDVRVIGLTMYADRERHDAMRNAGASESLEKAGPARVLLKAIRRVARSSVSRSSR